MSRLMFLFCFFVSFCSLAIGLDSRCVEVINSNLQKNISSKKKKSLADGFVILDKIFSYMFQCIKVADSEIFLGRSRYNYLSCFLLNL